MAVAYEIVTRNGAGHEHVRRYTSEDELAPGSVLVLGGRGWLVDEVEGERVQARPARYRLTLRHPDGREEGSASRRYAADAPTLGHRLTTLAGGAPVSWTVVEQRLAHDDAGEPFVESIAERDYTEADSLPDHQLEHALDWDLAVAASTLARAQAAGLAAELVALEPGEAPGLGRGVALPRGADPRGDPGRPARARRRRHPQRPAGDLARHGQAAPPRRPGRLPGRHRGRRGRDRGVGVPDGRVFAATGAPADEASPLSGYGWMSRLVDASVLGAAGFRRVRKADLAPEPRLNRQRVAGMDAPGGAL